MDRTAPSRKTTAERNLGTEREDNPQPRGEQTAGKRKGGRRRKPPTPEAVVPLDLLGTTTAHFFPRFNRRLRGIYIASRNFDKQDCELKAFGRLAEKLKQLFPKLPICLLLDSLYACAPVMEVCDKMNWSYIAVFTEGETPALWTRAVEKAHKQPAHQLTYENGTAQNFQWATMLQHQNHITHAVFCDETEPDGTRHTWAWISDHRPDRYRAPIIANKGGRLRWKIENEGFNEQKNGEFELKHDYGSKGHAWYNDYLVVQVAHMLIQLIQFGDLVKKASNLAYENFTDAFGTIRSFFVRLRESVNRDRMTNPRLDKPGPSIQIRLDTS